MILTRDVTREECDWLERDLKKGKRLYKYLGCTYGCISDKGIAMTEDKGGGEPFFEVPIDALSEEK